MKVCHVTMYYCPVTGGQQTYIENLIRIFSNHHIQSQVLQPARLDCEPSSRVIFAPRIPKGHYLGYVVNHWQWFVFNLSLLFCRSHLRKYDILLSNYAFHYPALRWHNKVIILSHGVLWSEPATNAFDKHHKRISARLKSKKAFIVANDTHFLRAIGYNVKAGTRYFEEIEKNVWFIPNCVDTQAFSRQLDVPKQNIILVPRNIRWDRGIHLAIQAFHIFNQANQSFVLKIAGGPLQGEYYDFCKGLTQELGLGDKVIFLGDVAWEQMVYYYNEAAASLIPTLEKEGTSLSALESMACGTPVVSTNVAGLLDLPCCHAAPTPEAVAAQLERIIRNLSHYASSQQSSVQQTFNLDNWEKAWIEIVNAVYAA